ncbi:MAG: DUF3368 domain-containing protein [Nitrospirae bacterium]|nr:DUF3368 domain-containing protein [Nitrospirota bacterium]
MIAVSNTSPLILLDKVEYLWILGRLFKKVIMPPSVDKEWLRPGGYVVPDWLSVNNLSSEAESDATKLYQDMDKGEAEAIALFRVMKADLLLLDDLRARRYAKSLGLPVAGTVGLLITAKQRGIISEIKPILDNLRKHKFYLSNDIIKKAMDMVNESY